MRNAIFAATTEFLDASPDRAPVRFVTTKSCQSENDGTRFMLLEAPQNLVRIRTASGIILDMSPETAFALHKDDEGCVMRWQPLFNPSAHNLVSDPASRIIHPSSRMYYPLPVDYPTPGSQAETMARLFIAGMVCATGMHSHHRSRATSVTAPAKLAMTVEDRILSYVSTLISTGKLHLYSSRHSAIDMNDGTYFLRSRVLTHMCNNWLTEKLQQPTELLYEEVECRVESKFAFLSGLLSALTKTDTGLTFYHRDADVVEWVGATLWRDFGVPAAVHVDPMEPVIQPGRRSARPHRLEIDQHGVFYATTAGLREGPYVPEYLLSPVPDPIVNVVPLEGRRESVIVVPGPKEREYPFTANGLQFNAAFEMLPGIESIAAHPSLVNDPAYF